MPDLNASVTRFASNDVKPKLLRYVFSPLMNPWPLNENTHVCHGSRVGAAFSFPSAAGANATSRRPAAVVRATNRTRPILIVRVIPLRITSDVASTDDTYFKVSDIDANARDPRKAN